MPAAGELDRYSELRPLGSGGMGEVVLARDTVLGREVALKRLRGSGDGDPMELNRLRREALVGASFSHPNLVAVYDGLFEDDDLVIVMEYVEGQTLRAALASGALPAKRAVDVVAAIAAALDHVHSRGVVHRDVKPANVLLGLGGVTKLGDLGIASVADRTRITSTGALLGTIPYMAPEQLEPGKPTPAVDIYALGAVAFEALGGRRARPETNALTLAHALATQPPPDLREVWPKAPAAAAAAIASALARNPKSRPASAGELATRLREALTTRTQAAPVRRARRPAPKPEPAVAAAAAGAAVPLLGASAHPDATPTASIPPRSRTQRSTLLGAVAVGLLALAALVLVLVSGSGGSKPAAAPAPRQQASVAATPKKPAAAGAAVPAGAPGKAAAPSPAGSPPSSAAPGQSASHPAGAAGASGASTTAAGGPVAAVKSFYTLAAAHRYADAWALADPAFRAQLAGFRSFSGQQSKVRSIVFDRAAVVSADRSNATVSVNTTPTLDTGVQHCRGTVQTQRSSGSWLVHAIAISC